MLHTTFLFLLFYCSLLSPNLGAETNDFKKALQESTSSIKNAGTIDYKANCPQCFTPFSVQKEHSILYSKENNQKINLSVLTPEEANKIFAQFLTRTDIPYRHIQDGCYARAHKMAQIMDEAGIISGKAFLEGHLVVDGDGLLSNGEWGYHVASLVLVKKNNELIPTIFDPSLFAEPVPYSLWKAAFVKAPESVITHEYFTNRYSYDFPDRIVELKKYKEEDLVDMELTNKRYRELNASLSSRRLQNKRDYTDSDLRNNKIDLHTEQ